MDMRSETGGVSQKESDEQQRNWTAMQWKKKAADSLANYDPTRAKLNFEVVRGGVVQPIDTSKSIAQKMAENLAARGIRDPNSNADGKRKYRTIAKFIFGGNRERMHELAFGTQKVDLTKGADNSGITRCQEIEDWARDVYNFMAKRYGEENIISFYVHLDEKNPHIHCTMVPVDASRNRISWKSVFGDGREAESANMTALHSELLEQVNQKWGLERGSNMEETKARHRSTEEYKRELVSEVCDLETTRQGLLRQIRRAEIKLKGISTMIANLRERKQAIQDEIDEIARQFGQDGCDHAALASRMAALRSELEAVKDKLSLRQQMLEDAERTILAARASLAALKQEHAESIWVQTSTIRPRSCRRTSWQPTTTWWLRPGNPSVRRSPSTSSVFSTSPASPISPTMLLVSSTVPSFSPSTASVRPPPTPSPMVAAPSITPVGDVTKMRTMSSGGDVASPAPPS